MRGVGCVPDARLSGPSSLFRSGFPRAPLAARCQRPPAGYALPAASRILAKAIDVVPLECAGVGQEFLAIRISQTDVILANRAPLVGQRVGQTGNAEVGLTAEAVVAVVSELRPLRRDSDQRDSLQRSLFHCADQRRILESAEPV